MQSIRTDGAWTVTGIVSGGHLLSHVYLLAFPPLFPLFRTEFQLNNTELGLIFSLVSFAPIFLQTPFGSLVDHIGSKRVFLFGLVSTSLGTMLVGLATSYVMLLGFVLIAGIGQSTFHPADFALLEAVGDDDRRGKRFSIHMFSGYVGFAAAPIVVGGIGFRYGWRPALLTVGSIGLLYAVFAAVFMTDVHRRHLDRIPRSERNSASVRDHLRRFTAPDLLLIFACFSLFTMALAGIQGFTTVYAEALGFDATTGNSILTTFLVATAIGILTGGALADRFDVHAVFVVVVGSGAALIWLLVSGLLPIAAVTLFACFAGVGFLTGLAYPARDTLVSTISIADETGRSFGFVYSGVSMAMFVTPTALGAIIDYSNTGVAFTLVGLFYAGATTMIVLLAIRRQ